MKIYKNIKSKREKKRTAIEDKRIGINAVDKYNTVDKNKVESIMSLILREKIVKLMPDSDGGKWEEGILNQECRLLPFKDGIWYGIQIKNVNTIKPIIWSFFFRYEISFEFSDSQIEETLDTARRNVEEFYESLKFQVEFIRKQKKI